MQRESDSSENDSDFLLETFYIFGCGASQESKKKIVIRNDWNDATV